MATTTEERKINIILDGKQVNASLKQMEAAAALMNNQLKKMAADDPQRGKLLAEFKQMKERIGEAKQELYGMEKASLAARLGLGSLSDVAKMASGFLLAGGLTGALTTVIGFFKSSSDEAKVLEASLSELSAITGLTGGELDFMAQAAQETGEKLKMSAADVVNAYKLMGGAKPELLQNKEALAAATEQAIILAQASKMELAPATDALASSLNQFGESADEAGRFINVMAAGAQEGSAEISDVAASLKNAGTVASAAGLSFEETNAAIQSLSLIAVKGGEAGTGLRNVLLTLQSGSKDTNPAVVGLEKALDNLGKKNLSTAELSKLFGKENVVVAQQLVKSRDEITRLTGAMTGTNTAYEQAATNMDNLEGDMQALNSVTSSLQTSIGKGLNEAIRAGVKILTSFILGIKEAPRFLKENQDIIYTLGAAILAMNAANIKTAATTLYHTAVEKGRAIATRSTAAAQWVLNAAMTANPIGLVVAAVAALVGGFVILYNRSEAVRGGIAGLWAGFKELLSIAGDVALFLMNPIKNAGKIKEIMNSGERLGKAFSDGYNNKIASEQAEKEKKDQEKHEVKKKAAAKNGGEIADAETEAEKKAREKAEKEAAKKRKEREEELKKAREDYNKAVEKSELELAQLKIEIMEDGVDKVIAKLQFQHDQEIKKLEEHKKAVLANLAATEIEKQAALVNFSDQQAILEGELEENKRKAREAGKKEDLQKNLQTLDEEEALKLEKLKFSFGNTLNAEAQKEEARLNLQKEYAQKRLDFLVASGQGETEQAYKFRNAILQADKDIADGRIANAKKTAEYKERLEQQGLLAATSFLKLGLDLLSEDEKARKKHAELLKAFSKAEILVNLYQEISGYMKHPASTSSMGVLGGIQAAIALVRANMAISKIETQKFAVGGSTAGGLGSFAAGGPVGSARLGLIGEAGAEWVGPNWMLTSPRYAGTFAWLEAERRSGGVRAFAEGGATAASAGASVPGLEELVMEVRVLGRKFDNVANWANSLKVDYHAGNAEEAMQTRRKIEENAGW